MNAETRYKFLCKNKYLFQAVIEFATISIKKAITIPQQFSHNSSDTLIVNLRPYPHLPPPIFTDNANSIFLAPIAAINLNKRK